MDFNPIAGVGGFPLDSQGGTNDMYGFVDPAEAILMQTAQEAAMAESAADGGQLPQYYRTRAAHCATQLSLPPQPRQTSDFVGLLNQGATCYMNSLFQTLYMTP